MNSKINSAADAAFDTSDDAVGSVSTSVDIGSQAPAPRINTVADSDYSAPMSGQQAEPTVKSVNLPDSDETKIKSAV